MQGALATLDTERAAADEDAWSSSSGSDADEAPGTHAGAGEQDKGGAAEGAEAAARAAEQLQGGLQETERERQVRLGLITPFQSLPGFSRGIVRPGAPALHPLWTRTRMHASWGLCGRARELVHFAVLGLPPPCGAAQGARLSQPWLFSLDACCTHSDLAARSRRARQLHAFVWRGAFAMAQATHLCPGVRSCHRPHST